MANNKKKKKKKKNVGDHWGPVLGSNNLLIQYRLHFTALLLF